MWLISSVTSSIRYEISYSQTILVIMVFRYCNSNIFNDCKRFFESKTWNCVCMVIFMGEKCVLARSENRESGPTAFQMIFLVFKFYEKLVLTFSLNTLNL